MTPYKLNQRQQKIQERKKRIIEQAKGLFLREGLANVTMQDVIDETGIAKATMYRYYDSIHDIALEVQTQMLTQIYGDLSKVTYAKEPQLALIQVYTCLIDGYEAHKMAYQYIGSFDYVYAKAYLESFKATEYDDRIESLLQQHLASNLDSETVDHLLIHLGLISAYLQKLALRESVYNQGKLEVTKRLNYLKDMVKGWTI